MGWGRFDPNGKSYHPENFWRNATLTMQHPFAKVDSSKIKPFQSTIS